MKKNITLLLAILLLFTFCYAEEFSPTTIEEIEVEIKTTYDGSISGLEENGEVVLQILTLNKENFIEMEKNEKILMNGNEIKPTIVLDEFGNHYARFELKENGSFEYILNAKVKNKAIFTGKKETNGEKERYIKNTQKIQSNSVEIMKIAKSKFDSNNTKENAKNIIGWVNQYVDYADEEFTKYYQAQNSALQTLIERKGVCDEFANLTAALLRAKKIPTKIVTGITFDGKQWGNHAWIEYYNGKEWVYSDSTFNETDFVDATHIPMGKFADISSATIKAVYPQNSKIKINYGDLPEIKIINKTFFDLVEFKSEKHEIKAKKWNEIKFTIKNNTERELTVPVRIERGFSEIKLENAMNKSSITKTISLSSREEREITYRIYPNKEIPENYYAKLHNKISSLSEPHKINIEIREEEEMDNGIYNIIDFTPIFGMDNILVHGEIFNGTKKDQLVKIIAEGEKDKNIEIIIPAFSQQKIKQKIDINTPERITLSSNGNKYIQDFNSQKFIIHEEKKEEIGEDKNIEIINPTKNKQGKSPIKEILNNPIYIILPILIFVTIGLLITFLLRKRYI